MAVIKNSTSHKVLSKNALIASSFYERLLGLLNPKNPRHIVIKTHFGIHTIFMQSPIDILLLNKENKIVKKKENFKPYRLFLYNPRFSIVIEMPEGSIKKNHIHINDKILIE